MVMFVWGNIMLLMYVMNSLMVIFVFGKLGKVVLVLGFVVVVMVIFIDNEWMLGGVNC